MDSGSQATFCTESLMRQLNMEGKKTQILLRTMGQEKLESSYHVKGLEVCGLCHVSWIHCLILICCVCVCVSVWAWLLIPG
jgi:hypothetical protein